MAWEIGILFNFTNEIKIFGKADPWHGLCFKHQEVQSFMLKKPSALSAHKEKRQYPRFPVKLPLDYWETPNLVQGGLAANISEAGLQMHSVHKIQTGTKLWIRVYFCEDHSLDCIEGSAKIIWRNPHRKKGWKGFAYGVYVMQMPPDYQDRLKKYILTLQEKESFPNRKSPSDGSRNLGLDTNPSPIIEPHT